VDGSEPGIHSLEYTKAIQLKESTLLKAQTFDNKGIPVGFSTEAQFTKVDQVIFPSWFSSLLAGKYIINGYGQPGKAIEMEVHGAMLVNIADDPDLIDATGGYNYGCFIKSIDVTKGKMWLDANLEKAWVIQQVNDNKVQSVADLQQYIKKYHGQTVTITAVRNYNSGKFNVQIP
jgi:hypothetical protein